MIVFVIYWPVASAVFTDFIMISLLHHSVFHIVLVAFVAVFYLLYTGSGFTTGYRDENCREGVFVVRTIGTRWVGGRSIRVERD